MSAAVRAVIVAMNWLATSAKVSGGVDLIFSDSFEECLAEPWCFGVAAVMARPGVTL
jgi:hypothetical protein